MWAEWWVWATAGLVLAIVEIASPGFLFLGFAIGAGALAGLLGFGLEAGLPLILVIYSGVSLVAYLLLRKIFPNSSGSVKVIQKDINEPLDK